MSIAKEVWIIIYDKFDQARESERISELPLIQLILPYKIRCVKGSLEIP